MLKKRLVNYIVILTTGWIFLYLIVKTNDYFQNDQNIPYKLAYFENKSDTRDSPCEPLLKASYQYNVLIDGINYPRSVPLYLNKSINFECLNRGSHIHKILFWTQPNWLGDEGLGKFKPFSRQNCPVTNCELTNDITQLYQSDLVITHMRDKIKFLPQYRSMNQRWVFMLYESPAYSWNYAKYNGFYNLSSTYKISSDFNSFYESIGGFEWRFNQKFDESNDFSQGKSGLAVAVISNCYDKSRRLEFIKEMQNYMSVRVFGKCGTSDCPIRFKNRTLGDCKEIIATEYKFYLAFENSICSDYITEKFFEILRYNIVPVVLGGGSYSHYVNMTIFNE